MNVYRLVKCKCGKVSEFKLGRLGIGSRSNELQYRNLALRKESNEQGKRNVL